MKEQRIPPRIRIHDAIDQDLKDAKITLNLLEKLTEQEQDPQTCIFSKEELETLIRNCVHAIVLNFTKTIETPKRQFENETYNLESLIDSICQDDDKDSLKGDLREIRGNRIYGRLVEYRLNIIAHRNIEYRNYQAIEWKFKECQDYLLEKKKDIEKLIGKMELLQMDIESSDKKKHGIPEGLASFQIIVSKE